MADIITWLTANYSQLLTILTSTVTLASLVAALTKTPNDDVWVGKIYKIIDFLALNIGKAKDKGTVTPVIESKK